MLLTRATESELPEASRTLPPFSRLRRRWVWVTLVLATVLLGPSVWWQAQARAREQAALAAACRAAAARWHLPGAPRVIDLQGRDTLVVGDSMVLAWPWPADRIALAGKATPTIRAQFGHAVQGRSYSRIVLWPGTAHFVAGNDTATYLEDVQGMIDLARSHSRSVVVVGPFPSRSEDYRALRRAERQIRRAQPDVRFVSLVEVHEDLVQLGAMRRVSRDGLHLTKGATAMLLGPRLASVSHPSRPHDPAT